MNRIDLLMRSCAGLFLLVAASGCDQPPSNGVDKSAASRPSAAVDTLRSLPYAGFSEENDDDADGVIHHDARSSPGLTLLSVHTLSRAILIEPAGKVIRTWELESSRNWDNVELLPDGDLLVVGADPSPPGVAGIVDEKRYLARFAWNGTLRWKRFVPVHHDVEQNCSGELLTLMFSRRPIPAVHATVETRDDEIVRLSNDGAKIGSIGLYDLVAAKPELFPLQSNAPTEQGGRAWVDLFHCNAIERMTRPELAETHAIFSLENALVTSRHQDRVAIVDLSRREMVWAWGQGELDGPHDAQVLPSGNLLIFDNGLARGWSRVIELDPIRREVVWEFKADKTSDFYTKSKGSCQRLPNGNTLICNSDSGRVFEVTPQREFVWDYRAPYKNAAGQRATVFRAKRFSHETIDEIAARAASQPAAP